ncbi:hypothetical protein [Mucilaginibacter celer]|uniref:Uncharacterized protein n=1 Tax=Mucilaginibacter celer TaxID=2305508 RepID=A0A494VQ27_9SPHI|nr:hypothetical protein [Mucilaginibacter celer]AYL97616.1 hypothetical protein HYN43_020990 [Mucilaginibacter celer]
MVSTVYADVEIGLIHKTDTMTIRVINSGYGAVVDIDSLVFKPGKYAIKCTPRVVNGKTLPDLPVLKLKQIDYGIALAEYYNYWLDWYKKLLKRESPEAYLLPKQFRALQRSYHISTDDLNYKTARDLGFKE